MTAHAFEPLHSRDSVARYVVAACLCGWCGSYTHASERFARGDWEFHTKTGAQPVPKR